MNQTLFSLLLITGAPKGGIKLDEANIEIHCIEKAKQGQKDSFRYLVEKYQKQALSTAMFLTNHSYTAQDVVQEAFVQCYFHLAELRDPSQFKWCFFRILTRTAWRYKKKDQAVVPIAEIFPAKEKETAASIEENAVTEEADAQKETLARYINQLEEKHRTVLILYYYNEFSVKEIAQILGCLEGTVKSRLYYSRQKLKNQLLKTNAASKQSSTGEKVSLEEGNHLEPILPVSQNTDREVSYNASTATNHYK